MQVPNRIRPLSSYRTIPNPLEGFRLVTHLTITVGPPSVIQRIVRSCTLWGLTMFVALSVEWRRLGWIPASNSEQWDGAGTAGEMAGGTL